MERKLTQITTPDPLWANFVAIAVLRRMPPQLFMALSRGTTTLAVLPDGSIQWHWESHYTCDLVLIQKDYVSLAAKFQGVTTQPLDSLVLWRGKCLLRVIDCKKEI